MIFNLLYLGGSMTSPLNDIFYDNGVTQATYLNSYSLLSPTINDPSLFSNLFFTDIRYAWAGTSPLPTDATIKYVFENFFNTYSQNNKMPQNFQDFKAAFISFFQSSSIQTYLSTNGQPTTFNNSSTFGTTDYFAQAFIESINRLTNATIFSTDWSLLNNSSIITSDFNLINPQNLFLKAFNNFLTNISYATTGGGLSKSVGADNFTSFTQQFANFFGSVAVIKDSTATYAPSGVNFTGIPTYETIYRLYGPTTPDFATALNQFAAAQTAKNGYFLPSQSFDDWIQTVRQASPTAPILDQNEGNQALILNRLIQLLISMVTTLQGVAVAQSGRLKFTTSFQQAYTALQTQIPVFLKGDDNLLGKSMQGSAPASTQATDRNTLNASFNSILTDNLRNLRGLQEDKAKQIQTNLNQTNDAVNQQTDLTTSFLQQLNSLLSSIFR